MKISSTSPEILGKQNEASGTSAFDNVSNSTTAGTPTDVIQMGEISSATVGTCSFSSSTFSNTSVHSSTSSNSTLLSGLEQVDTVAAEQNDARNISTNVDSSFSNFLPPKGMYSWEKDSTESTFSEDVPFPSNFIGHHSRPAMERLINMNPSILLPHQRATFTGPGTPMPMLPPEAYPYPISQWNLALNPHFSSPTSHWSDCLKSQMSTNPQSEIIPVEKKKKKRKRKKNDIIITTLTYSKKLTGMKRKISETSENPFQESTMKKVDKRLRIKTQTELAMQSQVEMRSSSSPPSTFVSKIKDKSIPSRFVDRATSPIDFLEISRKTEDTSSTSSFHFINPTTKGYWFSAGQ